MGLSIVAWRLCHLRPGKDEPAPLRSAPPRSGSCAHLQRGAQPGTGHRGGPRSPSAGQPDSDRRRQLARRDRARRRPPRAGVGRPRGPSPRRRRRDFGPAYIAGFHHVLDAGAGLVVQMDADFSHDPADIPRLARGRGGRRRRDRLRATSTEVACPDWGLRRQVMSRVGSAYAQVALGLPHRDLTGGFKVISREVLGIVDLHGNASHGYAFQVELTYRAARAGFRIEEIPIQFRDRHRRKLEDECCASCSKPPSECLGCACADREGLTPGLPLTSFCIVSVIQLIRSATTTRRPHDRQAA